MALNLVSDQIRAKANARQLQRRTDSYRKYHHIGARETADTLTSADGTPGVAWGAPAPAAPSWGQHNRAVQQRREMGYNALNLGGPRAPETAPNPAGLTLQSSQASRNALRAMDQRTIEAHNAIEANKRADAALALDQARFQDDQLYRAAQMAMGRERRDYDRQIAERGFNFDVMNAERTFQQNQRNADRAYGLDVNQFNAQQQQNQRAYGLDLNRLTEEQKQNAFNNWMQFADASNKWSKPQADPNQPTAKDIMAGRNQLVQAYSRAKDRHQRDYLRQQIETFDQQYGGGNGGAGGNGVALPESLPPMPGEEGYTPPSRQGVNIPQGGGGQGAGQDPQALRQQAAVAFVNRHHRPPSPDELDQMMQILQTM